MSTTNLPHNRWAALLEDNLDATQVHRLIAESVAEREAALLQDPGSASAHSTPATSSQQLRSAPRRATHPRDAVALPSSVSQSACSSRASSPSKCLNRIGELVPDNRCHVTMRFAIAAGAQARSLPL